MSTAQFPEQRAVDEAWRARAATYRAERVAAPTATSTAAAATDDDLEVDMYIDPVCPYAWLASRWLLEVQRQRPLVLRFRVMSLYMLNEGRDLHPGYRDVVDGTIGPSLVAAAITEQFGADALSDWYTAFGSRIFDYWRVPGGDELLSATRHALETTGLPESLAAAGETGEYIDALRRSHMAGVAPVGPEAGTPIVHFNGIGFFGPILNSVPRGEQAVRLFDAAREFAGFPDFFELKRTRVSAPVFG